MLLGGAVGSMQITLKTTPDNGALDGRITRDGNDDGGSIVPITILHHNDLHGNLAKGTYVGYTQLATLISRRPSQTGKPAPCCWSGGV